MSAANRKAVRTRHCYASLLIDLSGGGVIKIVEGCTTEAATTLLEVLPPSSRSSSTSDLESQLRSADNCPDTGGVLPRIYQRAVSLPDASLHVFQQRTAKLPRTTEAERLVVQRIGQAVFRSSLMDYWRGRCPLTGI